MGFNGWVLDLDKEGQEMNFKLYSSKVQTIICKMQMKLSVPLIVNLSCFAETFFFCSVLAQKGRINPWKIMSLLFECTGPSIQSTGIKFNNRLHSIFPC
jgi:hypothetical protein